MDKSQEAVSTFVIAGSYAAKFLARPASIIAKEAFLYLKFFPLTTSGGGFLFSLKQTKKLTAHVAPSAVSAS